MAAGEPQWVGQVAWAEQAVCGCGRSSKGDVMNTVYVYLLALLLAISSSSVVSAQPNLVVVLADDLDAQSLTTALANGLMPNLNQYIVGKGLTFTESFVTDAICCPSRATLLTGRYSHNHGVRSNIAPTGGVGLFADSSTLATWLQGGGYFTSYIGKYLNGYGGVDVTGDGLVTADDLKYIPPGWNDWRVLLGQTTYHMWNYSLNLNGVIVRYGETEAEYQTDVLADQAINAMVRHHNVAPTKPLFLLVAPVAPHVEKGLGVVVNSYDDFWKFTIRPAPRHAGSVTLALPQPPSFNELDMTDKPAWVQGLPYMTPTDIAVLETQYRNRLESLRAVDDLIGRVVGALAAYGMLPNTALVFTSDNGYMLGEHRTAQKESAYEESIRVPLFVRTPATVTIPSSSAALVLNTDLAPTMLELAGVTPGMPPDGTSFVPLLTAPSSVWRRRFIIEHVGSAGATTRPPTYDAIRTSVAVSPAPKMLYVEYADGTVEFYALQLDPYERTSLHDDQTLLRVQQRALLSSWLGQLRACVGAGCHTLEFAD